jgi:predicted ATPase/class 3 adenylate cyclase
MMRAAERTLPTGIVTFVFTDIEGSTELLRTLGDDYLDLLDLHDDALRVVWARHGGVEVAADGDAFFVAFESADDAVAATVDAQAALAATSWVRHTPVLVRMGIHSGFARPHRGNYAALAVNQAARLVDAAHGGQVLLSPETARLVTRLPDGAELESLGRFRLRDFPTPQELHQVRTATLPVRQTAPRARPADGHNLLRVGTTLHGRHDDLQALAELVAPGSVVTLVGPGGIGKTRLATEHGLQTAQRWEDGVWFVDLAAITDRNLVDDAVAEAVGVPAVPGRQARLDVLDALQERQTLLLLDNCEHLAPVPAELAHQLVEQCAGVGVLATSRSPLGLRVEQVHRLRPLAIDGSEAPAVRLFLDRSAEVAPADLNVVRELCEALDGLPLAIELAAARSRTLGPRLLLDRLGSSLSVIRGDDPSLPDRQRTLEAVLDWSYDLLEQPTRQLLCQLALFPAGFDLDVVLAAWPERSEDATIEELFTLVDGSLVHRDPAAGEARFRLPATVRAHGLARSTPEELVGSALAVGRVLAERIGPERATSQGWMSEISMELDNLRAVIHRVAGVDDELGQSLAWAVCSHHDAANAYATGIDELARYLDLLPSPTPTRIALLALLADLHLRVDHTDAAADVLRDARALHATVPGPHWDDACVARTAAELALKRGELAEAVAIAEAALGTAVSARSRSRLLSILGIARAISGDLAAAVDAFRAELRSETEAGMHSFLLWTHGNLAEVLLQLGDEPGAASHQLEALDRARTNGDIVQTAFSMLVAARLCIRHDIPEQAVVLLTAATTALDDIGFVLYESDRSSNAELLRAARGALGAQDLVRAEARGRQIGPVRAADEAEQVLRDATTRRTEGAPTP